MAEGSHRVCDRADQAKSLSVFSIEQAARRPSVCAPTLSV